MAMDATRVGNLHDHANQTRRSVSVQSVTNTTHPAYTHAQTMHTVELNKTAVCACVCVYV
jgi:hypothetical protein